MTSRQASGATHRRLLGLLLAGSMALYAFPLWWGSPGSGNEGRTWAFDEILSGNPGTSARLRHGGRYPPFHYLVLRVLQAPVRALARLGVIDADADQLRAWLQLLGRLLSVLMATTSVYWIYRSGLLLVDRPSALFGAATWALVTPLTFFAKTVNLDVPYIFWFTLSLLFFLRILAGHRLADYLAFAATGMVAITTKDQAYALYLLPALALVFDLAQHLESPSSRPARLGRALVDRRLVLGLLLAVAVFVVVHNPIFDWQGFRLHIEMIAGSGSDPGNALPSTVQGHLALAAQAVRHTAFSMTWPLLLLAGAGVVIAVRNRLEDRALLLLLLFPASYYLTFISVIHYHRLRFFLPVCAVLALFAARGSSFAWVRGPRRRWAALGLLVMLGWAFVHSLSLDLLLHADSRYEAEAWMAEAEAAGLHVLVVGDRRQVVPRSERPLVPIARLLGYGRQTSRVTAPEYVVVNETEFLSDERQAFLRLPQYGGYNYVVDRHYARRPALDLLRMDGLSTNLTAISPRLTVLRRVDSGISVEEMDARAGSLLAGGPAEEWSALLKDVRDSGSVAVQGLGPRVVAYGLNRLGVLRGAQPGVLVVTSRWGATIPRVRLSCVARPIDCPVAVEVVTAGSRQRVELVDGEVARLNLEPLADRSQALVLLVAIPRGGEIGSGSVQVKARVTRP